jgi:peptide/nickel transport system substrate-binding protein
MVLLPAPSSLPPLRRGSKFTLHETPGVRVVGIDMHAGLPPLDDARVRQALFHAIDRKAILENILEGAAVPARGLMAPGVFGAKDLQLDRVYPYDQARAKALLAQAGWTPGADGVMQKGGQRLAVSYLTSRGRFLKDYEITEAAQAMLREIGVETKIETGEWASVFTQARSDPFKHHLYTSSWLTVNLDADATLFTRYHSKQVPPTGWNNFRYANPRVDALVEQARRSVNQGERERLYGDAQEIILKEPVQIPIYNTRETVVTRAYVKGFVLHPIEYNLGLSKVWLDK